MRPLRILLLGLAAASAAAPMAFADDCASYQWDVSQEHALFGGAAVPLTAATRALRSPTPAVTTERLYAITLVPQTQLSFVVPPGKVTTTEGYAGIARVRVPVPGTYRVAVDVPLWIDVVARGKLATVVDFQGRHECETPRKIVEFDLRGKGPFMLQLSGSPREVVRLTVTRAP